MVSIRKSFKKIFFLQSDQNYYVLNPTILAFMNASEISARQLKVIHAICIRSVAKLIPLFRNQ